MIAERGADALRYCCCCFVLLRGNVTTSKFNSLLYSHAMIQLSNVHDDRIRCSRLQIGRRRSKARVHLSASAVVIHYEEALYQVYGPLPVYWLFSTGPSVTCLTRRRQRSMRVRSAELTHHCTQRTLTPPPPPPAFFLSISFSC